MEHFLILAWLGDLLRDKKINQREHVILDYLGRQPEPVELMQFKNLLGIKKCIEPTLLQQKAGIGANLINDDLITQPVDGFISLNAFKV
jgi:hypothetical protein